jgi:type IV pilus assembly protein PilV
MGRVRHPSLQAGATLIEILVALVLVTISIVALLRILAVTVKDSGEIGYRAQAIALAEDTLGRMWVDRANLASYAVTNQALGDLPNGRRTVAVAANVVSITIRWRAPGTALTRTYSTTATITGN